MLMLCCYMFRPYKAISRQHLLKDSNSLYATHIRVVFPRYVADVPSYLFDLFELRLFLYHIRCVALRCEYQALPCVPCDKCKFILLIWCITDGKEDYKRYINAQDVKT
jgi:hypothetical protein